MVRRVNDSLATYFVLRVFCGPLQGCEFVLTKQRTLFLVGPEVKFCSTERPLIIPDDAIYIPLESGGCNFEVLLDDNSRSGCIIRTLSDESPSERHIPFQVLESIACLQIAVRALDDSWAEQLLVPLTSSPLTRVPATVRSSWLNPLSFVACVVLLIGLAVVGWYSSRASPVSNMEALIGGANSSMALVYGRDRHVYVFAESERDAGWARQVLVRNGYPATKVLATYDERGRLEKLIDNLAPQLAYHRLDLSDPAMPKLWISRQRNVLTPDLEHIIETELIAAASYAREVQIVHRDDDEISRLAEEGLERLALPFIRKKHYDSVTFIVEGSLQDSELRALSEYVSAFSNLWGGRYVHFAIELKDDWLKGRSFRYGPQGYVKMSPSSWYFPKTL